MQSPGCTIPIDAHGRIAPDVEEHGDADQSDFAVFQRCFSSENVPADLNCANRD